MVDVFHVEDGYVWENLSFRPRQRLGTRVKVRHVSVRPCARCSDLRALVAQVTVKIQS
jgi:hypothetical protein